MRATGLHGIKQLLRRNGSGRAALSGCSVRGPRRLCLAGLRHNWAAVMSLACLGAAMATALLPWLFGGSAVEVCHASSEGGPGGYIYMYTGSIALGLMCLCVALALSRALATLHLRRQPSAYHSLRSALSGAYLTSTVTAASLSLFLATWILLTDVLGLVSPTTFPPAGRVGQLFARETMAQRLPLAAAITAARSMTALCLAALAAIAGTLAIGELPVFRIRAMPWLKALALIPPAVLFTFSPYINQLLLPLIPGDSSVGNFERDLEACLGGRSVLTRVLGQPGHLIFLSSVAIWPLLISGLDHYGKWSAQLRDEIRELRLPWHVAVFQVKLPNVLVAIGPAFHIAIVLLLVVSYSLEGNGAVHSGVGGYFAASGFDGVFGLYLHSTQESARDLLVFGILVVVIVGLCELLLLNTLMYFFSGSHPALALVRESRSRRSPRSLRHENS